MLCTLQQIKDTLGITDNASDTLLTRLGNAATAAIEKYINRTVEDAIYTQVKWNGDGSNTHHVREYPIITLTSIEYLVSDYQEDDWDTLETELYTFDANSGTIYSQMKFNTGFNNWRITYLGGYTVIPYDIEDACIRLACNGYNTLNTQGIKTEAMGDRRVEYFSVTANSTIKQLGLDDVLDKYRQPLV